MGVLVVEGDNDEDGGNGVLGLNSASSRLLTFVMLVYSTVSSCSTCLFMLVVYVCIELTVRDISKVYSPLL